MPKRNKGAGASQTRRAPAPAGTKRKKGLRVLSAAEIGVRASQEKRRAGLQTNSVQSQLMPVHRTSPFGDRRLRCRFPSAQPHRPV